ncbi:Uncharacterised protein [Mycobacterium tuberculosis]|nr:Uncharacterised protein [Mycobacterium tuberculosis]
MGEPISNGMDQARRERAKKLLQQASTDATNAIQLVKRGQTGEALKAWRALFGTKFPLS